MADIVGGNLVIKLKAITTDFEKSIEGAKGSFGTLSKSLAIGGGAVAGTLALMAKSAMDLNKALGNVQTLMPKNVKRIGELKSAIQDLSISTNKNTEDLTNGAYQVVSAFGDTADTVKVLEISAKAATAGVATTTDAINLFSSVSKGYNDVSAESISNISDLAFQTVKLGQTTFPELAASMGRVVPLATELNVTQRELFAVMATATGVTGKATEVSTQFRGVLQSLLSPTDTMTELIEEMGFSSGKAMLKEVGLKGSIDAIVEATKNSDSQLKDYIGSIEGQTLALTLAGSQSDTYNAKLEEMKTATGATEEAFIAQKEGVNEAGFSLGVLQKSIVVLSQTLGEVLLPAITPVIQAMTTFVIGVKDFLQDNPELTKWLVGAAAAFSAIALAVATTMAVSLGLPALIAAFTALGTLVVAGGPFILALAAVASAIYAIYTNWDTISELFKAVYDTIISPTIDAMKTAIISIYEGIESNFKLAWEYIENVLGWIWDKFSPLVDFFMTGFEGIYDIAETVFKAVYNYIAGEDGVIGKIYNSFRWLLDKLGIELPEAEDLFEDIQETGENAADGIKGKWTEFKDSFNKSMIATERKQAETSEAQTKKAKEEQKKQTTDYEKEKENQTDKVKEEQKKQVKIIEEKEAEKTTAIVEEAEKAGEKQEEIFDETMLVNEERHDEFLEIIQEKTPTAWGKAFEGVSDNFDKRIGEMGDAWMEDIHHGNFQNAFKFIGSYLKQTFEASFLDIGGNILQSFVDKIKTTLTDSLVGVGSNILSSLAGGGGGIGGTIASVAGSVGSSALGGLGAVAGGLGAVAVAAAPIAIAAALGYGAYKAADAILKGMGVTSEHTSQRARSRQQAKKTDSITARYAGFGAANISTGWTKMTNVDMQAAKNGQIAIDAGESVEYEANRQGDSVYARSIKEGQKEEVAQEHKENVRNAILLYATGDLATWHKEGKFHSGGIIPGIIGQEKRILALAGEEVITRNDPRHSQNNFGGINVIIQTSGINSSLDAKNVGDMVAKQIMHKIKLQTKLQV